MSNRTLRPLVEYSILYTYGSMSLFTVEASTMPMTLAHIPWDRGALYVLSKLAGQKSIKTLCNRRVPFRRAIDNPLLSDCPDCRQRLARSVRAERALCRELGENLLARHLLDRTLTKGATDYVRRPQLHHEEGP